MHFENIHKKWGVVLRIAWPLIIANAFWNIQLLIDRIFLGQHSSMALGAAVAAAGVFWVPMALLQNLGAYISTFVAQYSGANESEKIGRAVWQAMYVCIFGGLAFLLLQYIAPLIFSLFKHSDDMKRLEIVYFSALCYSALPTSIVALSSGFFTGIEKTKVIMRINALGMLANILFDYVLIFGNFGFPQMGIAGAGYATALAAAVSMIYGCYEMFQVKFEGQYKILSSKAFSKDITWRFLRFGLPSGLQWALEGFAFTFFLIMIGRMPNGDAALTATSITLTITHISILPCLGVAQAVGVLVGKYLGEKAPEKAVEVSWSGIQMTGIFMFLMGITFVCFPSLYIRLFSPDLVTPVWLEAEVMIPYLLMFVALFTLSDSFNFVLSAALKGAGDTKYVSLMALFMPWPLMVIPTTFFVDSNQGIYWAWGFASLYIIVLAAVFLHRFLGGKWKSMSVIYD